MAIAGKVASTAFWLESCVILYGKLAFRCAAMHARAHHPHAELPEDTLGFKLAEHEFGTNSQ